MEVLDARPIFRAGGGVKCRSRGRKKVVPKPSGKVSCRESALLATKLTYEKTYLVSRDDCSGRSGLVHDGGNPTDRNHHDPYRDRGGTHAHQHEHDCHPAKRGRLLSRRSENRYKGDAPLRLPFSCRALSNSLPAVGYKMLARSATARPQAGVSTSSTIS
jgi:hypothetical protein